MSEDNDRFDRLVVFDVIFCLMDADGNQLRDDAGNMRVFCNHHASSADLADNALGDSDIADVVNQSRGWREAKTPFGNPKEYSELIIKIWDYLTEMVERGDDDARQLLEKLNLETKQLLEIDIALETKQLLKKFGEDE